jgi:NAD(P)-dependent dehydrogenase (short-subunit alcohol dehydrogenase family)
MTADPLFSLDGRSVIVTGGLGLLGARFTRALLRSGARVAVFELGVTPERVEHALGDTRRADLAVLEADVTRRESLERALAEATERFGPPFGLVNNAAIDVTPAASAAENGPFETYPESAWDRMMEVNVKGVMLASQVVGGALARAGRGSIVNIGSIYGSVSPDQRIYAYRREGGEEFYKPVTYSVSKSALLNLTRYLATYWAERQVRVNTLTLAGVRAGQHPEFVQSYVAKVPLGRMAEPDEYDGALVFLLSEASRYMTGSNLVIDGGFTAW